LNFTIDGYTVAGPASPPSVKAGQQATIQITVTPTANGFTNAVTFTVSGLPLRTSFTFNPPSVTPNGAAASSTLTVTTQAGGSMPPTSPVEPPTTPLLRVLPFLWFTTLLAAVYASRLARRAPQLRRYAVLLPLVLLLITGAALAGCIGGKSGTPKGPAQLTITATSGTMSQTTNVTLTVQ